MTNVDQQTTNETNETVVEDPFLHRESIHVRFSKDELKTVLRDAALSRLQAEQFDTSLISDMTINEMGFQMFDGVTYLYFQEPWPEGYSVADAMAAAAAAAQAAGGTGTA